MDYYKYMFLWQETKERSSHKINSLFSLEEGVYFNLSIAR